MGTGCYRALGLSSYRHGRFVRFVAAICRRCRIVPVALWGVFLRDTR